MGQVSYRFAFSYSLAVSVWHLFLLFFLTKLNMLLHCWKQSWALFWYTVWSPSSSLSYDCIETWKQFPSVQVPASLCLAVHFEGEVAEMCRDWRLCLFVFVLGPRATSQCPSAQDAGFGGSADHAVSELPGVLHTRYAMHHGRVAHRAGLLRSGWHELSWYLIWWGSRQVSGLSLLCM